MEVRSEKKRGGGNGKMTDNYRGKGRQENVWHWREAWWKELKVEGKRIY